MTPENLKLLSKELERDEDRRSKLYKCSSDKWSIGIGRNLEDKGLREDEIDYLFANDVKEVEDDLDRALPWWRGMSEVRQRVLANMCFNLGLPRLLGFENTLVAMKDGNYVKAAQGMLLSKWARQVGDRAKRLAYMMEFDKVRP